MKVLFVTAMSDYMSDHEGAIADLEYAQRALTDTDFIDEDIRSLEHELEITSEMIRVCINGNALNIMSEEEYRVRHSELCKRFEDTEQRLKALKQKREQMKNDDIAIGGMLFELMEIYELSISFNDNIF